MADVRRTVTVSTAVLAWATGLTASSVAFGPVVAAVLWVWVIPALLFPLIVLWDHRAARDRVEVPAPASDADVDLGVLAAVG